MVDSIIQAVASALAYFAAREADALIGKWLAYFTIAWEQVSTASSKTAFNETMDRIKNESPSKAQAWADWRKRAASQTASSNPS